MQAKLDKAAFHPEKVKKPGYFLLNTLPFYQPMRRLLTMLLLLLTAAQAVAEDRPLRVLLVADQYFLTAPADGPENLQQILTQDLARHGLLVEFIPTGTEQDSSQTLRGRLSWQLDRNQLPLDLAILAAGSMDPMRGIVPAATGANLEQMVRMLQMRQIPILLVGVQPVAMRAGGTAGTYQQTVAELAARYDLPHHPDLLAPLHNQPSLQDKQGTAPNTAGLYRISALLVPVIRPLLTTAPGKTPISASAPPAPR